MIRVTVELLRFGDSDDIEHLGTAYITNNLTGTPTIGNYNVRISKRGNPKTVWKRGTVKNFKRKSRGAWDLLYLALKNIVGKRNDTDT